MNAAAQPHLFKRARLVVIGNGMAAMRTVEELLALSPVAFDITVFGAEPHVNYNRILLSSVLAGEKTLDDIVINSRDWYAENGIRLLTGDPVVAIDRQAKTVTSASGMTVAYDKLLIATGSNPLMPPLPGLSLSGVISFRDIGDVEVMLAAAKAGKRAVVIGGGLLGLEAAWGLKRQGMPVALVHLMPTLMERQLDTEAGTLLQRDLTERGLHFFTSGQTEEILGSDRVTGVRLADGREIPADLVVMAIGIRPNIRLAKEAGLEINRGIVVNDGLVTSDPDIHAVGECIEHRGQVFGLVAPIWEQAKVIAARLAGSDSAAYATPPLSTRLKITGIDVFSAGQLAGGEGDEEVIFRDPARGIYKKLVIRDDQLVGAVLYGDVADGGWYFGLLNGRKPLGALRDTVIFGQAFAAIGSDAKAPDIMAEPDDMQVCGCNGVSKGKIVSCIREKGLTTLDQVRAHTKASASCGQCTPQVMKLLEGATGGVAKTSEAICACTSAGHAEIRKGIVEQELKSQEAVRRAFHWTTPDGCAKCRPALNYYLLASWPEDYTDDSQSRFVNERLHANIQKDGTYSVVPRMWGGLTTPDELRAIADIADRYEIPMVKATGGQRIDLLGVKKEDLPKVWADLNAAGMVSGHAYAKGLRTVKTCVGSEWCRFGTQDSTGLGVKLEQYLWGSWTPAKVKLGVSGCPRNCAEATVKDIGVICVEAGYDIHVAGAAGLHVRATDLLGRVASEQEAIDVIAACMQLYREEGFYLERIYKWTARVGLDHVRARVLDDAASRAALVARFEISQAIYRKDPWAERTEGPGAREFSALAVEEGV